MEFPAGERGTGDLRVDFARRARLEFGGCALSSDGGSLAFREIDGALGLKANVAALADLSDAWIDAVLARRPAHAAQSSRWRRLLCRSTCSVASWPTLPICNG